MHVVDIMTKDIITVSPSETAYDATSKMLEHQIGSVIVKEGERVVGIITKSDILRSVVKGQRESRNLRCNEIMSSPVVTVDQDLSIEAASKLMSKNKVSKLPVVKNDDLVGILTATDIIGSEPLEVEYLQEIINARFVPHDRT